MATELEMRVFQLDDEAGEFMELELDADVKYSDLLSPDIILLFVKPSLYRAWIWQGSKTSTRSKFIAAKVAPDIRDNIGSAIKLSAVDENDETLDFKVAMGWVSENEEIFQQTGPAYVESEQNLEDLRQLSLDKIVLLLEKIPIPEGYKREMILYNNNLYGFMTRNREYMGFVIEEIQLVQLNEKVTDGPYLAEGYIPHILFSYNKIILVELLKKMTEDEFAAWKAERDKQIADAEAKAKEMEAQGINYGY